MTGRDEPGEGPAAGIDDRAAAGPLDRFHHAGPATGDFADGVKQFHFRPRAADGRADAGIAGKRVGHVGWQDHAAVARGQARRNGRGHRARRPGRGTVEVDLHVGDVEDDAGRPRDGVRDAAGEKERFAVLLRRRGGCVGGAAGPIRAIVPGHGFGYAPEPRARPPQSPREIPVFAAVADDGTVETADGLEQLPAHGEHRGDDETERGIIGVGQIPRRAVAVLQPVGIAEGNYPGQGVAVHDVNRERRVPALADGHRPRVHPGDRRGDVPGCGDGVAVQETQDLAGARRGPEIARRRRAETQVLLLDDGHRRPIRRIDFGSAGRSIVGDDDAQQLAGIGLPGDGGEHAVQAGRVVVMRDDHVDGGQAVHRHASRWAAATSSQPHSAGASAHVDAGSARASAMAPARFPRSTTYRCPGQRAAVSAT